MGTCNTMTHSDMEAESVEEESGEKAESNSEKPGEVKTVEEFSEELEEEEGSVEESAEELVGKAAVYYYAFKLHILRL